MNVCCDQEGTVLPNTCCEQRERSPSSESEGTMKETDVVFVDAGDGRWVDVLQDGTWDVIDYGVPIGEAVKEYGPHPITTLEALSLR